MDHLGKRALLLAATTLVLGVSACGGDDVTSAADPAATPSVEATEPTTATPSADGSSGLPSCTEVWADGSTLPADYSGCTDGADEVAVDSIECSSGQTIVMYADTYWAVPGAVVNVTDGLSEDKDFKRAKLSCFG